MHEMENVQKPLYSVGMQKILIGSFVFQTAGLQSCIILHGQYVFVKTNTNTRMHASNTRPQIACLIHVHNPIYQRTNNRSEQQYHSEMLI